MHRDRPPSAPEAIGAARPSAIGRDNLPPHCLVAASEEESYQARFLRSGTSDGAGYLCAERAHDVSKKYASGGMALHSNARWGGELQRAVVKPVTVASGRMAQHGYLLWARRHSSPATGTLLDIGIVALWIVTVIP